MPCFTIQCFTFFFVPFILPLLIVFAARMNVLSLQNSNLIIIPHCLSKFPALSKLDLSLNRLESVDSAFLLNALPQLQDLNLSNNRIRNIAQIQVYKPFNAVINEYHHHLSNHLIAGAGAAFLPHISRPEL